MRTNSLMRAERACRRQAYLAYDLALESVEQSEACGRGSAFHAELAGAPYECNPFLRAAVGRVAAQFREREAEHVTFDPGGAELLFVVNVPGLTEQLGGTIDRALGTLRDGRRCIVERKTSTDPEGLMQALDLDTQVLTYWIGAQALGLDIAAILYCVQPWPSERPKKATPIEKRKFTKEKVDKKTGAVTPSRLYSNQRERDETPEEFAARLDIEEPIFREVPVLHDTVAQHIEDLIAQERVAHFVRENGLYYRNPQACGDCDFVPICRLALDQDSPPPAGFRRHSRAGSAAHQPAGGA